MSWVTGSSTPTTATCSSFTREALAIFRENPVFRRRGFFAGRPLRGGSKDVTWLHPLGREMTPADWDDRSQQVVGMLIDGEATDEVDERGRPVSGQTVLLLFNGGEASRRFVLPEPNRPGVWEELVNTARPGGRVIRRSAVNLVGRSFILATRTSDPSGAGG